MLVQMAMQMLRQMLVLAASEVSGLLWKQRRQSAEQAAHPADQHSCLVAGLAGGGGGGALGHAIITDIRHGPGAGSVEIWLRNCNFHHSGRPLPSHAGVITQTQCVTRRPQNHQNTKTTVKKEKTRETDTCSCLAETAT